MSMANEQPDPVESFNLSYIRSTPVPNRLLEIAARLPSTSIRVLLVVIRMTLGWQAGGRLNRRAAATISYREILHATGLRSAVAVSRAVNYLVRTGIIETVSEDGMSLLTGAERRGRRRPLRFRLVRTFVEER